MLWSSKMGANEFFSHFFSVKSCRECRNALPLHSQSGSNALARESYALNATRQQKCCCDLWKSYITDCREVQGTIDHEAFFLSGKKLLRVKWIVPSNSTPKQNKGYRNLSNKTENKQISYLQWRVWSWLRMNASYRLNTCKSRGSGLKACFQCRRPAHGCVTRIKPASYSGIALRK